MYSISVQKAFSRADEDDSDYNDDFRITFTDEKGKTPSAIKGAFSVVLASDFPAKSGLKASNESDGTVQVDQDMESGMLAVFVFGDANRKT